MTIPLISIGNSRGIRLSKTVIEKYNIKDSLEMIMEKDRIILKPSAGARKGWDAAFKNAKKDKGDRLLIHDIMDDDKFEEWK